jgi:hypothetical protein
MHIHGFSGCIGIDAYRFMKGCSLHPFSFRHIARFAQTSHNEVVPQVPDESSSTALRELTLTHDKSGRHGAKQHHCRHRGVRRDIHVLVLFLCRDADFQHAHATTRISSEYIQSIVCGAVVWVLAYGQCLGILSGYGWSFQSLCEHRTVLGPLLDDANYPRSPLRSCLLGL